MARLLKLYASGEPPKLLFGMHTTSINRLHGRTIGAPRNSFVCCEPSGLLATIDLLLIEILPPLAIVIIRTDGYSLRQVTDIVESSRHIRPNSAEGAQC